MISIHAKTNRTQLVAALSLCQAFYDARKTKLEFSTKKIYFNSLDFVTMHITSFTNVTRVRQDAVQSVLDPRYKKVCATATDGLMFGGEFQKQLKEVKENQKVSPLAIQPKIFVSNFDDLPSGTEWSYALPIPPFVKMCRLYVQYLMTAVSCNNTITKISASACLTNWYSQL